MIPSQTKQRTFVRLQRARDAASSQQSRLLDVTAAAERRTPAMSHQGGRGRALQDIGNSQGRSVPVAHGQGRPVNKANNNNNRANIIPADYDDELPNQVGHDDYSDEEEEGEGPQDDEEQHDDAIPRVHEEDAESEEEDSEEAQRESKRARLMDYDLRLENAKAMIPGELEPSELLQKLLEAMLVNNMLTQDTLLMLESVDYRLAKGQMQTKAADPKISEKSTDSVLDASMTGPILEYMWDTSFFAIEGFGAALAKAAKYKDLQELQGKSPGLYMRLVKRIKPVTRELRKKKNSQAKQALTNSIAYGELMKVKKAGAKPSSHVRKLLYKDTWAREVLDDGRHGKLCSNPGFKMAAAQMYSLESDNGNPPRKLALKAPQLAYLIMWGRHLLQNDKDMPNNTDEKQVWQTEYDIISTSLLASRANQHIDYTGWPALPTNNPAA